MSTGSYCLTLPSSSSSNFVSDRKSRIQKNGALAKRRTRKVKWAKRTVIQRDIRNQIDKEFEEALNTNQDYVEILQSQNEELKNKCASLLNSMQSLVAESAQCVWNVPEGDSSDSDTDSDPLPYLPLIDSKKSQLL